MVRRFVFLASAALLGPSCSDASPLGPDIEVVDHLRVVVNLEDRADRIVVNLEIRNLTSSARSVRFPGTCNPAIVVRASGNGSPVVWRELDWRFQNGSCISIGRNADLAPGGTTGTRNEIPDLAILGDSLAPGGYRVTVAFQMSEPFAMLEFDGGEVRLAH